MRVLDLNEQFHVEGAGLKPVSSSESRLAENARIAIETCGKGNVAEVTETSFKCK